MATQPNKPSYGRVWTTNKTQERSPDYDGRLTLADGTEVKIALWAATNGFSIRVQEYAPRTAESNMPPATTAPARRKTSRTAKAAAQDMPF